MKRLPSLLLVPVVSLSLAIACSSDDSDSASADASIEIDAQPEPLCLSKPVRLVVLGDSIGACVGGGGKNADTCSFKLLHDYFDSTYAPGLSYENLAVGGAVTADVPDEQLAVVPTGAGHVVVAIYVGGNDLRKYMTTSDEVAMEGYEKDLPGIKAKWDEIFSFFDDAENFPDGVTILMNNQYTPFDDCTAAPYNISQVKQGLLKDFNSELQAIADAHSNAFLTDQFTPYLGHGHHYNEESCPHYQPGLTLFMYDTIHPNEEGHANLAKQWQGTVDSLYEGCQ